MWKRCRHIIMNFILKIAIRHIKDWKVYSWILCRNLPYPSKFIICTKRAIRPYKMTFSKNIESWHHTRFSGTEKLIAACICICTAVWTHKKYLRTDTCSWQYCFMVNSLFTFGTKNKPSSAPSSVFKVSISSYKVSFAVLTKTSARAFLVHMTLISVQGKDKTEDSKWLFCTTTVHNVRGQKDTNNIKKINF